MGRIVGAHSLKYASAVMQRVGEHMGCRLSPWNQLPISPDVFDFLYWQFLLSLIARYFPASTKQSAPASVSLLRHTRIGHVVELCHRKALSEKPERNSNFK